MTKAELVEEIHRKTKIEREEVKEVIESYFESVKDTMAKGENIYVRGFGTFEVVKRAEKTARNISKGTSVIVPEHYKPVFKPCPEFVNNVRNKVR